MTREPTEMERRCVLAISEMHTGNRAEAEAIVRTVIRAMYEPTPEMVEQVRKRLEGRLVNGGFEKWLVKPWQAMIDAASPPEGK